MLFPRFCNNNKVLAFLSTVINISSILQTFFLFWVGGALPGVPIIVGSPPAPPRHTQSQIQPHHHLHQPTPSTIQHHCLCLHPRAVSSASHHISIPVTMTSTKPPHPYNSLKDDPVTLPKNCLQSQSLLHHTPISPTQPPLPPPHPYHLTPRTTLSSLHIHLHIHLHCTQFQGPYSTNASASTQRPCP